MPISTLPAKLSPQEGCAHGCVRVLATEQGPRSDHGVNLGNGSLEIEAPRPWRLPGRSFLPLTAPGVCQQTLACRHATLISALTQSSLCVSSHKDASHIRSGPRLN